MLRLTFHAEITFVLRLTFRAEITFILRLTFRAEITFMLRLTFRAEVTFVLRLVLLFVWNTSCISVESIRRFHFPLCIRMFFVVSEAV